MTNGDRAQTALDWDSGMLTRRGDSRVRNSLQNYQVMERAWTGEESKPRECHVTQKILQTKKANNRTAG